MQQNLFKGCLPEGGFPPVGGSPSQNTQLTILSFGAGQDSTALLYMYVYDKQFRDKYAPGRFLAVMSDTGDEHQHTYSHIENIKIFCEKHDIGFVLITPEMGYHAASWQSLRGFYRLKNTVGGKGFPKSCSDKLKCVPIYKFIEAWLGKNYGVQTGRKRGFKEFAARYGKIQMMIGIAKGEEKRCADPAKDTAVWRRQSINTVYPLIDLGMGRAECQSYIKSVGHEVPYPSNCMLCPFLSKLELLYLERFHTDDYHDWVKIEKNKLAANTHMEDRNLGVWGKKTLPKVLAQAKDEYGDISDEKLIEHKFSHGHCVMSKY